MKSFPIVGFVLSYILFVPPTLCEIIYAFLPHAVVFRNKVPLFHLSGDCDDNYHDNDAILFSLLDSKCSRATPRVAG
jgi:hypothetical protein